MEPLTRALDIIRKDSPRWGFTRRVARAQVTLPPPPKGRKDVAWLRAHDAYETAVRDAIAKDIGYASYADLVSRPRAERVLATLLLQYPCLGALGWGGPKPCPDYYCSDTVDPRVAYFRQCFEAREALKARLPALVWVRGMLTAVYSDSPTAKTTVSEALATLSPSAPFKLEPGDILTGVLLAGAGPSSRMTSRHGPSCV